MITVDLTAFLLSSSRADKYPEPAMESVADIPVIRPAMAIIFEFCIAFA